MVKVKVSGINIVLDGLKDYGNEIEKKLNAELKDWADRTTANAIRDTPVKTGDLRSSIRAVLGNNGLTWIVKVGGIKGVNYAPYVVFGTGAFVDKSFLQEYGLVQYASQFKGQGVKEVNLPARDFLYANARAEFQKTLAEIKKIIESSRI